MQGNSHFSDHTRSQFSPSR